MALDLISFLRLWIRGAAFDGLSPAEICREVNEVALPAVAGKARLLLRARFYLAVRGFYPVITLKTCRWGPIAFYLVRCREHGLYLDYPHGYDECFICPRCLRESAITHILEDIGLKPEEFMSPDGISWQKILALDEGEAYSLIISRLSEATKE